MQGCGNGCHRVSKEAMKTLSLNNLCLCVFGVVAVSLARTKLLFKFVAQQRGHFSISWELRSVDLFIWFLDSLGPMLYLEPVNAHLKHSHTSLFHSLTAWSVASTLDHSCSMLFFCSFFLSSWGWRKSHNLESCIATDLTHLGLQRLHQSLKLFLVSCSFHSLR